MRSCITGRTASGEVVEFCLAGEVQFCSSLCINDATIPLNPVQLCVFLGFLTTAVRKLDENAGACDDWGVCLGTIPAGFDQESHQVEVYCGRWKQPWVVLRFYSAADGQVIDTDLDTVTKSYGPQDIFSVFLTPSEVRCFLAGVSQGKLAPPAQARTWRRKISGLRAVA
jgi:hypothetical protein